jgi:hypothetical protein
MNGGKREICLSFDLRQVRDGSELKENIAAILVSSKLTSKWTQF